MTYKFQRTKEGATDFSHSQSKAGGGKQSCCFSSGSRMNMDRRGHWTFLDVRPMVLLLLLCLHLQGSSSRCIDVALGQDLQPLPPGVQRCSLPSGLLQPDVSPPGQGGDSFDGGGSRIVGGSPATSARPPVGSFPTVPPTSQGGSAFQYGKPGRQVGRPEGPVFGGHPTQYGRPRDPGPYGNRPQYGPGPVTYGRPGGSIQYGGDSEPYGGDTYDGSNTGIRFGRPRVEWKNPGIPYIPSAKELGGGYIPLPKEPNRYNPNGPYGGGGGGEASMESGPRGRYDGSYGPIPESLQPGGGQSGRYSSDQGPPCLPNC